MLVRLVAALSLAVAGGEASVIAGAGVNPISKVIQLLSGLETKIVKEGEEAHKTYAAFTEWCEDRARNLKFEIKTGKADAQELEAEINKASATIASLEAKIEETASGISTDEGDLKAAAWIRQTEDKDFQKADKEMSEIISALSRAISILEREMRKGDGSALVQFKNANGAAQAIKALVDAAMIRFSDGERLAALVQSKSDDDDQWGGAPAPSVYENHGKSIVDTLEDLLDKAKEQQDESRKKETNSRHNYEMLKQSLSDEIKFANQEVSDARKGLNSGRAAKATAEGDLDVTKKELSTDISTQSTLKQDCMSRSQDYEAGVKSRDEELKALSEAKKVITEQTSGATDVTYGLSQVSSFVQLDQRQRVEVTLRTSTDLANFEAVRLVRTLAEKEHDDSLLLLARRMSAAMRYGDRDASVSGEDPFGKVKGLIKDMITSLEKQAQADASHKAYCDAQLGETLAKKETKEANIDKLTSSIDTKSAKSTQLKGAVAELRKQLAELARAQAELTSIRNQEKQLFEEQKPEMENGLQAVKMAMKILREYYEQDNQAHSAATGAGNGIIGMLEVVEADFSKTLAEMSAAESQAKSAYEEETRANEIQKATAEQSEKYKSRESEQLDADAMEHRSDREGVQAELTAIMQYKEKIIQMCVSKPMTYEERKGRRESEIAGLKEALTVLEGEAVLLQRRTGKHLQRLRGLTRAQLRVRNAARA